MILLAHLLVLGVLMFVVNTYAVVVPGEFVSISPAAASSRFGLTYSTAMEGNTAVFGDYGAGTSVWSGSIFIFDRTNAMLNDWTETAHLLPSLEDSAAYFGAHVSISGPNIVGGANQHTIAGFTGAGACFVFHLDGTWSESAVLTANDAAENDLFGQSVYILDDIIVVGARGASKAYIFRELNIGTGDWTQVQMISGSDDIGFSFDLGDSVRMAKNGDKILIGASRADSPAAGGTGAVYPYLKSGVDTWAEGTKLYPDDGANSDRFGYDIAMTETGLVLCSSPFSDFQGSMSGAMYVFEETPLDSGDYTQRARILGDAEPALLFGHSVAFIDERPATLTNGNQGALFIFEDNGNFNYTLTIKIGETEYLNFALTTGGSSLLLGAEAAPLDTVDDCALNTDCQNDAHCVDGFQAFTCACSDYHNGNFCETCLCEGGGVCEQNGAWGCDCAPAGANGDYCEFDIDDCEEDLCSETCTDMGAYAFTCSHETVITIELDALVGGTIEDFVSNIPTWLTLSIPDSIIDDFEVRYTDNGDGAFTVFIIFVNLYNLPLIDVQTYVENDVNIAAATSSFFVICHHSTSDQEISIVFDSVLFTGPVPSDEDIIDWLVDATGGSFSNFTVRWATNADGTYTIIVVFVNPYYMDANKVHDQILNSPNITNAINTLANLTVVHPRLPDEIVITLEFKELVDGVTITTYADKLVNDKLYLRGAVGGAKQDYDVRWVLLDDGTYQVIIVYSNPYRLDPDLVKRLVEQSSTITASVVDITVYVITSPSLSEVVLTFQVTTDGVTPIEDYESDIIDNVLLDAVGGLNSDYQWRWVEVDVNVYTIYVVYVNPYLLPIETITALLEGNTELDQRFVMWVLTVWQTSPTRRASITLEIPLDDLVGTIEDYVAQLIPWLQDVIWGTTSDYDLRWVLNPATNTYTIIVVYENPYQLIAEALQKLIEDMTDIFTAAPNCVVYVVLQDVPDAVSIGFDFSEFVGGQEADEFIQELLEWLQDSIGGRWDQFDIRMVQLEDTTYRVNCVYLNPFQFPVHTIQTWIDRNDNIKGAVSVDLVIVVVRVYTSAPYTIKLEFEDVAFGSFEQLSINLLDMLSGVFPGCHVDDFSMEYVQRPDLTYVVLVQYNNRALLPLEYVEQILDEFTELKNSVVSMVITVQVIYPVSPIYVTFDFKNFLNDWTEEEFRKMLPYWLAKVTCFGQPHHFDIPRYIAAGTGNVVLVNFPNRYGMNDDVVRRLLEDLEDIIQSTDKRTITVKTSRPSKHIKITLDFTEFNDDTTLEEYVEDLYDYLVDLLGGERRYYDIHWLPDVDGKIHVFVTCPSFWGVDPDIIRELLEACECINTRPVGLVITVVAVHPRNEVSIILDWTEYKDSYDDNTFLPYVRTMLPLVCGGYPSEYIPLEIVTNPDGTYTLVVLVVNVYGVDPLWLQTLLEAAADFSVYTKKMVVLVEHVRYPNEVTITLHYDDYTGGADETFIEDVLDWLQRTCGGYRDEYRNLEIVLNDDGTYTVIVVYMNIYQIDDSIIQELIDRVKDDFLVTYITLPIIIIAPANPATSVTITLTFDDYDGKTQEEFLKELVDWLVATCGGLPTDYRSLPPVLNPDGTYTVLVIYVNVYQIPVYFVEGAIQRSNPISTSVINLVVVVVYTHAPFPVSIVLNFEEFAPTTTQEQFLQNILQWIADVCGGIPRDFQTPRIVVLGDGTYEVVIYFENRYIIDDRVLVHLINTCPYLVAAVPTIVVHVIPAHPTNPVTIRLEITEFGPGITEEQFVEALRNQLPFICGGYPRDYTITVIYNDDNTITVYVLYINVHLIPAVVLQDLVSSCSCVTTYVVHVVVYVVETRPHQEYTITLDSIERDDNLSAQEFVETLYEWLYATCGGYREDYVILDWKKGDEGEITVIVIYRNVYSVPHDVLRRLLEDAVLVHPTIITTVITVVECRHPYEQTVTVDFPALENGITEEEFVDMLRRWLPTTCGGAPQDYVIHVVTNVDGTITVIIIYVDVYLLPPSVIVSICETSPVITTYCPGHVIVCNNVEPQIGQVTIVVTCGGYGTGLTQEEFLEELRQYLPTVCGGYPEDYTINIIINDDGTITVVVVVINTYVLPPLVIEEMIIGCPTIVNTGAPETIVVVVTPVAPIYDTVIIVTFTDYTPGITQEEFEELFREFITSVCGGIPSDYVISIIPNPDPNGPELLVHVSIVDVYVLDPVVITTICEYSPVLTPTVVDLVVEIEYYPPPKDVVIVIEFVDYVDGVTPEEFLEELTNLVESICGCGPNNVEITVVENTDGTISVTIVYTNTQIPPEYITPLIETSPVIVVNTQEPVVTIVIEEIFLDVTVEVVIPGVTADTTIEEFIEQLPGYLDNVCTIGEIKFVENSDGTITIIIIFINVYHLPLDVIETIIIENPDIQDSIDGEIDDVDVEPTDPDSDPTNPDDDDTDMDPCLSMPCMNGQVCLSLPDLFYECIDNMCISSPCLENAECVVVDERTYDCVDVSNEVTITLTLDNVTLSDAELQLFAEDLEVKLNDLYGEADRDEAVTISILPLGNGTYEMEVYFLNSDNYDTSTLENTVLDEVMPVAGTIVYTVERPNDTNGGASSSTDGSGSEEDEEDLLMLIIICASIVSVICILTLGWYCAQRAKSERKMVINELGEGYTMPV